jgi:hypothetical protein
MAEKHPELTPVKRKIVHSENVSAALRRLTLTCGHQQFVYDIDIAAKAHYAFCNQCGLDKHLTTHKKSRSNKPKQEPIMKKPKKADLVFVDRTEILGIGSGDNGKSLLISLRPKGTFAQNTISIPSEQAVRLMMDIHYLLEKSPQFKGHLENFRYSANDELVAGKLPEA